MAQIPERERWTDEQLDRFANSVAEFKQESAARINQLSDRVDRVLGGIDRLVEALHVELPAVRAEVNGIREELRESNETAKIQAESIRDLVRLLNQKQA